ncbi:lipopolysaccharide heptosyltransferase I [Paraburkholderia rhizosphaerae]|uniref:Lipopolysaccharide heptosyltransferase 1 n=1 Tax=Paraburkholderia rhizosphaerae TaxID=480658 RepID=A0A4R8LPG2_9BURK|nr:lipopolysaccharide heptosyltransferase I [Paraburkholderia rhizosphaerae]TDY46492.1 heptosyltransferase-1 [Paraburkholderia rhizosphaerae]
MKRILVVKVTSLGDVIQAQAVVADLKRAFPGVAVDWACDEAHAEVARWNQSVDRVLCAPLRRFKKARRWSDFKAIAASIAELRAYRYDVVVDIHGVYKSAIIAFLTRSKARLGYHSKNLGEQGAAFAYTGRFAPRRDVNAWQGMRDTVADALGYKAEGAAVYNLRIPSPAQPIVDPDGKPIAVLFHATSKDDKKWPIAHWVAVAAELVQRGFYVVLPWGSESERNEAQQIAAQVPQARVLPPLSVSAIAQLIDASSFVIGVDTGFVHLAHALGKRSVMIFIATSPTHFGNEAPYRSTSIGDGHSVPPVARVIEAIDYVHSSPPADGEPGGQGSGSGMQPGGSLFARPGEPGSGPVRQVAAT